MNSERNFSLRLFQNLISESDKRMTKEFPRARSGHRMVADNKYVYILGGYNPAEERVNGQAQRQSPLLRDLWRYNILTKRWKKLDMKGKIPEEVASHCMWLHHNYFIVFGGTDVPFGFKIGMEVKFCNLETNIWQILKTEGDKPTPCYGQGLVVNKDQLILVGGTSGNEYFFHMHILDLSTKVWRKVYRHIPTRYPFNGSYRHELALWENKVYCFGGGTDEDIYPLDKILMYDLAQNKVEENGEWQRILTKADPAVKDYPANRSFHGLAQRDQNVYISGGHTGISALDDIWHLDLITLTWRKLAIKLPRPVYFHSMAINKDGRLFMFGGVSHIDSQNERVDDFSIFWVAIPPLLTLALDAVKHYFSHLTNPKKALEFGLPRSLVDRFV